MGSTNKTTNLGLSQFIGTDKPTWLVDYNNDMSVIDEAIGELQNDSGLTDTAIAELQTNVQNLQSGQGDSATEIAEVKSSVQTLGANYETMHHEVVLLDESVKNAKTEMADISEDVATVESAITELTRVATPVIYLDVVNGNDENSGLKETEPLKTINAVSLRAGKFTTALSVHIKAGTTVEISGNVRINNMTILKTYGTGDNAKIKATDSAQIRTTDRLTIDKIDFENAVVDSDKFFDLYAPYLAFNDCNFTGYGFAVFAPSLLSRCAFTDVVNFNPIGTIIGLRACTGRIRKMGGFGAMINIDETNLTVENFTSPYVKNNYS